MAMLFFYRSLAPESDEDKAQPGQVGDDDQSEEQQDQKGQGGPVQLDNRAVKAVGGQEKIEPDGRRGVAYLQVGQKDDAQMDGIDPVAGGDGQNERHDQDQGREDVQHAADDEQKDI